MRVWTPESDRLKDYSYFVGGLFFKNDMLNVICNFNELDVGYGCLAYDK